MILLILTGMSVLAQVSYKPVILPPVPEAAPVPLLQKQSSGMGTDLFLGLSYMPGIRLGQFKDSVKTGMNLLVEGEVFLNERFSAGIQTGYFYFKTDEVNLGKGQHTFIPACLKATYYFLEHPFRPYGGLSVGYFISKKEYTFQSPPYFDPVTGQTIPGKEMTMTSEPSCAGVSPLIGFYYDVNDQFAANIGAQFFFLFPEGGASNFFGIKFGAVYKLGI